MTLEDILEEIVGEFTTDPATITHKDVHTRAARGLPRQRERHHPGAEPRAAAGSCRPTDPRPSTACCSSSWRPFPTAGTTVRVGRLRVRGPADRRQRHPHRARAGAAGAGERLGPRARERRLQRLARGGRRRCTFRPGAARAARCPCGTMARAEPLRVRLLQALLAVGHRAHLAGEADLPEGDQLRGRWRGRARLEASASSTGRSQAVSEISMPPTTFTNTSCSCSDNPGVAVQRPPAASPGDWHPGPARRAAAHQSACGPPAPAARSAAAGRPRGSR